MKQTHSVFIVEIGSRVQKHWQRALSTRYQQKHGNGRANLNSRSSAQINRQVRCGVAGEGVESRFSAGAKRSAEFSEKHFARLLIFFRLLFLLNLLVPNETRWTTTGKEMRCEIYRPASSPWRRPVIKMPRAAHPDVCSLCYLATKMKKLVSSGAELPLLPAPPSCWHCT